MTTPLDRYGNPMTRANFARAGRQYGPAQNHKTGNGRGWLCVALGLASLLLVTGAIATAERLLF